MHDHLIIAIGSQILSRLCLLDLSATFDTIVQLPVFQPRLEFMAVSNWFKSYLSSHSFVRKCEKYDKDFSSEQFFLWCSSKLCSWSSTFRHVYIFQLSTTLLLKLQFRFVYHVVWWLLLGVAKLCSGCSNCSGRHSSTQKTAHTIGAVTRLL